MYACAHMHMYVKPCMWRSEDNLSQFSPPMWVLDQMWQQVPLTTCHGCHVVKL